MFGNDKGKGSRTAAVGVETLIGAQSSIRGDLHFSGGLYIEGKVHGAVVADEGASAAVLTIADKGCVQGEIRAPVVVINGQLNGDAFASERIELGPNARIEGNIHYKVVQMAAGAMVTGRMVHIESMPQKQLPKPEAVKTARDAAA